jgi:hypothetical protein
VGVTNSRKIIKCKVFNTITKISIIPLGHNVIQINNWITAMKAFKKHIWKRLIYIALTAFLVTSCQSRNGETDDLIVENPSISQQAIRENPLPSSQTVKSQPLTAPTPPDVKTVKPKSAKTQKTTASKNSSNAKAVKGKSAKVQKTTANKNSAAAKVVQVKSTKVEKNTPAKTAKTVSFIAENPQKNEVNAIKAVFYQNIQGLNTENLDLAMGVIDKNNSNYEQVKQLTQTLFNSFDLNYAINKLEIMEVSGNEAKVKVTQTTKKLKGLGFRDNVVVSVNTVKKYNGQWKIANTKAESINYLN